MRRGGGYRLWIAAVGLGAAAGVAVHLWRAPPTAAPPPQVRLRVQQDDPERLGGRYVFDISVHTRAGLEAVLERVEALRAAGALDGHAPAMALVLHGPEISFFTRKNYPRYRDLVDRVRALDAAGVIETKMCQTMMRAKSIRESDVPDFIEFVPYGPAEIDRLVREEHRIRI